MRDAELNAKFRAIEMAINNNIAQTNAILADQNSDLLTSQRLLQSFEKLLIKKNIITEEELQLMFNEVNEQVKKEIEEAKEASVKDDAMKILQSGQALPEVNEIIKMNKVEESNKEVENQHKENQA